MPLNLFSACQILTELFKVNGLQTLDDLNSYVELIYSIKMLLILKFVVIDSKMFEIETLMDRSSNYGVSGTSILFFKWNVGFPRLSNV